MIARADEILTLARSIALVACAGRAANIELAAGQDPATKRALAVAATAVLSMFAGRDVFLVSLAEGVYHRPEDCGANQQLSDRRQVIVALSIAMNPRGWRDLLHEVRVVQAQARRIVVEFAGAIRAVADGLLLKSELTSDQILTLLVCD
jgi:hypothetical protein